MCYEKLKNPRIFRQNNHSNFQSFEVNNAEHSNWTVNATFTLTQARKMGDTSSLSRKFPKPSLEQESVHHKRQTPPTAADFNVKNVPIICPANYDSFFIYHKRNGEARDGRKSPMWPVKDFYWNQTVFFSEKFSFSSEIYEQIPSESIP